MSFKEFLEEGKLEHATLEVSGDVKKTIASLKKAGFKAKEADEDSVSISFSNSEDLLKWAADNGHDKDDFEF